MDIAGISSSVRMTSSEASSTARANVEPVERQMGVRESRYAYGHGAKQKVHALGAFRQELRLSLESRFHVKPAAPEGPYWAKPAPTTPEGVAEEALGAAKQVIAESPTSAAKTLISFKARVAETASYVRQTLTGQDEGDGEVGKAVAKIDAGLTALEDDVAANRESRASVLEVDTRSKQKSIIKIRTQEGDVVKLSLKRMDTMSATDVSESNGQNTTTSTEVEVSSRSRMMLKVEGDLNESELAAIQNVFAKAEQIADEFFDGDIGAAFNLAQGLEFDTEQLARVNMRFRMTQVSNVSFAESIRPAPLTSVATPEGDSIEVQERPVPGGRPVDTTPVTSGAPSTATPVAAEPVAVEPAAEPVETEASILAPTGFSSSLESFFDSLRVFLQSVGEGFATEEGGGSLSFHYSESFKLNLLKAVVNTVAPEESTDAAANAESVIDQVSA